MTTQPETTIEQRLSRLEGAYEQVNERLGDLSRDYAALRREMHEGDAALRAEMNAGFADLNDKIDRLRGEMHRQTILVIGVLGGLMAVLRFVG